MDFGLKGKKAIVTGETRGIGRAIAETLAREGCDVGICARHEEELKQTVAALEALGVKATGSAVDVAQGEALRSWIESAEKTLGGLDILVPNVSAMDVGAGRNPGSAGSSWTSWEPSTRWKQRFRFSRNPVPAPSW